MFVTKDSLLVDIDLFFVSYDAFRNQHREC